MSGHDRDQLTVPPDGASPDEQPRWRQDFPIDWPEDRYISQRDFIKFLVLTSLAFVAGQLWLVYRGLFGRERSYPLLEIARRDAIPVGGSRIFHYPERTDPCILLRLDQDTFVAYRQQCTHLTCPVVPRPESRHLYCPCHNGLFDVATGQPLAGPPRRPLVRVQLEVRGDVVHARGFDEGTA
ncbi:MAG TPA: Rieske (2Fe-2S) protein [Vicinamibacteria bacterium]